MSTLHGCLDKKALLADHMWKVADLQEREQIAAAAGLSKSGNACATCSCMLPSLQA